MKVGRWIYGLATIATGLLNIIWRDFDTSHQPVSALGPHLPGEHALACIAGAWLVAAGMSVLWRPTVRAGVVASATIYLIFALLWLPRLFALTHSFGFGIGVVLFGLGGAAAQILLAAPAAIVYADAALPDPRWQKIAALAAHWIVGLPPIAFGFGHLINLAAYARFVPHWVPFAKFWVVFTGLAFLLAGCAIVSGIRDVLAARMLALMLLLFEFSVEAPPVFLQPHSLTAWGGAVYNLTAIGVCWLFVEFVTTSGQVKDRQVAVERVPAHHSA